MCYLFPCIPFLGVFIFLMGCYRMRGLGFSLRYGPNTVHIPLLVKHQNSKESKERNIILMLKEWKKEEKTAKSVFLTFLVKHDISSKKHATMSIMQQMLILNAIPHE